jgi:CheY-like chemotaxis protein
MRAQTTLLLVEDDADVREAVGDTLEDAGYRVLFAKNGREALDLLRGSAHRPALILLDLMMPVMDGPQFRKEQVADPRLAAIPVVVLSAHPVSADLGVAASIRKPVAREPLIRLVGRICGSTP